MLDSFRVAMGSLLSPVIANLMEDFEAMEISRVATKPMCQFCYADDTFVIRPHGHEELKNCINHLSNTWPNIHLTMVTESNWPPTLPGH
jgi:hypothetical protein